MMAKHMAAVGCLFSAMYALHKGGISRATNVCGGDDDDVGSGAIVWGLCVVDYSGLSG